MKQRRIVALCGLAGCGKTTVAAHLVREHLMRRVRFAGPLKRMMAAIGLNDRHIEGDLKEKPCELLGGKTPRYAMQTIGTQWGRGLISESIWVDAWRNEVSTLPEGVGVVADDVRFTNELAAARATSPRCLLIKIERPGMTRIVTSDHVSEAMPFDPDVTVMNDASTDELYDTIDRLVAAL